ncbi:MAG: metallophosphoesterase family protein [Candidatus Omnitrophota bacterium]
MVYGIFSDIHGNLEALEALTKALTDEKLDRLLCVGDIVGYGANPLECIDMISDLKPAVVCGNHDAACCGLINTRCFNDRARSAVIWTKKRIRTQDVELLQGLKHVFKNGDITMAHGTLHEPESFNYMINETSARATFDLMDTKVCFVGHSHVPGIFSERPEEAPSYFYKKKFKLTKEERAIINVGSVGQPRDGDPRSCYCIYDSDARSVEFKRMTYDVQKAQKNIINAGLPSYLAFRLGKGV